VKVAGLNPAGRTTHFEGPADFGDSHAGDTEKFSLDFATSPTP